LGQREFVSGFIARAQIFLCPQCSRIAVGLILTPTFWTY